MRKIQTHEEELSYIGHSLINTIYMWKKEINTNGYSFDYDSQDIYRTLYEDLASQIRLLEEYPIKRNIDKRERYVEGIKTESKNIIMIYEKHKKTFRQFDRKKLFFNSVKEGNPIYYKYTDDQLIVLLLPFLLPKDKDAYYDSELYRSYGFLMNDYHFEIYILCKHFLAVNYNKSDNYDKFTTFIDHSKVTPYFSMGLIYDLYEECNDKQFEETSELEFYLSLNLMNIVNELKIKKSENKRALYVIHMLSSIIENPELKSYWLSKIQNILQIDEKYYQSKYRDVKGRNATDSDISFANAIDYIFKE